LIDFLVTIDPEEPPTTLEFTDISLIVFDAWHWDFGDGKISTDQNPHHRYHVAGIYSVTFTGYASGTPSSVTKLFFARSAKMCSISVNGSLIINGELSCNGDIQIAPRGYLRPIPDESYKKPIFSSHEGHHITPNGKGRTITSLNHSIGIYGLIDGQGLGFGSEQGPGCNSTFTDSSGNRLRGYGATHSGLGAINLTDAPPPKGPYGCRETPVSLGSGSGFFHWPGAFYGHDVRGGGAIKIVARSGEIIIEGSINMNGDNGVYAGGGSGGSIWLIGWIISGDGTMMARGGTSSYYVGGGGGGGGGYISLWHEQTFRYRGLLSVDGDGPGSIYTEQIVPILEDRFTGSILNSKWWAATNDVVINNNLTLTSAQDNYAFPHLDSTFIVEGRSIIAEAEYLPVGSQIEAYNASFLLYADPLNWVGLARKYGGIYGISSANGIISSSGEHFDNTNVTFRIIKTDSTFDFQYYDSTNPPITLYTDIRPELEFKDFKIRLEVNKSDTDNNFRTDQRRLTPLDIYHEYLETDGTASDNSSIAMNVIHGTSQYFGLDFYDNSGSNRICWDALGLSSFQTPFQYFVNDYFTITQHDVIARKLDLSLKPLSPENVAVSIVHGSAQQFGVDYTTSDSRISWLGLGLEGLISEGDIVRVQYYYDPWDVIKFRDQVEWQDVVRIMYPWYPSAVNAIQAGFDHVKIYEGIVLDAETTSPVVYVDSDTGSDSSSGDQLSPLKNLFVATAWAKKGGTVVLYDGTYNSTAVIRKDLTIRGAEGVKPLITSAYVQDTTGSGWETKALYFYGSQGRIENVTVADSSIGMVFENSGNFEVVRCDIHDTSTAVRFINCDPVVLRNRVYDAGTALDFTSSNNGYMNSNVIYDSSTAIRGSLSREMTIVGNTISDCCNAVVLDRSSTAIISSNNMTFCEWGLQRTTDTSVGFYYNNLFYTVYKMDVAPDDMTGNIGDDATHDPQYVNRSARDYHIGAYSPNRGTGQSTFDLHQMDYDGIRR
jgi:PKD repeat protein